MPELLQVGTGRAPGGARRGAAASTPAVAWRFWLAVSLLVLVVAALKAWQGHEWDLERKGPLCYSDELIYKQNAEAINGGDGPAYSRQYPLGYPLLLSVALKFDQWYLAILVANALLVGLSVLLTGLVARRFLPPGWALAVAAVFALSPIHTVFPVLVLSENLAVPVLLGSVYALVTLQRDSPAWRHTVFGALSLANWTVKFIGLVQLPALALAWFFLAGRRGFLRISPAFSALAGGLMVLALALAFGQSHGLTLKQTLFGPFDVAALSLEPGLLINWLLLYGSYLLLAMGPMLPLVVCKLLARDPHSPGEEAETRGNFRFLMLLLVSLAAGLILVSARHSALVLYNQPQPQYLLGRYLVTLTPLGLLLGAVALHALQLRGRLHPAETVGALLVWLPAAWLAQSILVEDRLRLDLSTHFTAIPFNTPEVGALRSPHALLLFLALGTGSLLVATVGARYRPLRQAAVTLVFLGCGYWLHLGSTAVEPAIRDSGAAGIHARMLADRLREVPSLSHRTVGIRLAPDLPHVQTPRRMVEALRFWGVTGDIAIATEPDCSLDTSQIRVETALEPPCPSPVSSYLADGQRVFVCIREGTPNPRPCILDYGPRMAEAGTVFNPQAHGYSGLWFRVRNVTPATELLFNGTPLKPTVMRPDFATAALPPSAYPAPGAYPLRFRDPGNGVMSNTVFLDVK